MLKEKSMVLWFMCRIGDTRFIAKLTYTVLSYFTGLDVSASMPPDGLKQNLCEKSFALNKIFSLAAKTAAPEWRCCKFQALGGFLEVISRHIFSIQWKVKPPGKQLLTSRPTSTPTPVSNIRAKA